MMESAYQAKRATMSLNARCNHSVTMCVTGVDRVVTTPDTTRQVPVVWQQGERIQDSHRRGHLMELACPQLPFG